MVTTPKPKSIEDALTLFPGVIASGRYSSATWPFCLGSQCLFLFVAPTPPQRASRLPGRADDVQESRPLRLRSHSNREKAMSKKNAQNMPWRVVGTHVIPNNDFREHSLTDCWCRPEDDDGVIIHHSFDRRELYEYGERKLS
jgi:hypothetical protein